MSMERSLVACFALTVIIYGILIGTIFYEEPSCITTPMDYDFLFPLVISGIIAVFTVWFCSDIGKAIKDKFKWKEK